MENKEFDRVLVCDQALVSSPSDPTLITRTSTEIAIKGETIVAIGEDLAKNGVRVEDWTGKVVLPGLIDSQVHFRDPGFPEKETFTTGTTSAILGGITTVLDMPNTKPNTSTRDRYLEKLENCDQQAFCDFGLFIGATPENSAELSELEKLPGCCGLKIFMGASTGDLLVAEDEALRKSLSSGQKMVAIHSEDHNILVARKAEHVVEGDPSSHPEWRNVESAVSSTRRILKLAQETGRKIHVLHITTGEELEILAQHRDISTVECLPQHLFFTAPQCYKELGTRAQMNPPIRVKKHQEALWKAVEQGLIHVVGSDHAPHTLEEKARPYPQSPSGMPGVQTIVPIMLNFVNQGKLSLEQMTRLLCIHPARLYKMKGKGGLYVGQHADFTVVDLNERRTLDDSQMASQCGWTPYHGQTVQGWPVATYIRGQKVMENDKVLLSRKGRYLEYDQ